MSRGAYNYSQIKYFGSNNSSTNDPLTYCLVQNWDKNFTHSPTGDLFGPYSEKCQLFMAERCSKEWDGFCEYYYQNQNTQQYPNTVQGCDSVNDVVCKGLTVGETLLTNAAERRFCKFPGCTMKSEPFDPNIANSPWITYRVGNCDTGNQNCVGVCTVDPRTIDQDSVMNKCLENPKACMTTLANICNTSRRNGIDLSGTKIKRWCDVYFKTRAEHKPMWTETYPGKWKM